MPRVDLNTNALENLVAEDGQKEFYDSSFTEKGSFGIRVNGRGTRSFFLIYSLHGQRKRMTIGQYPRVSLEQARQTARSILEEVDSGKDPALERKVYKSAENFGQLSQLFVERYLRQSRKESTKREYLRIINKELLPCWRDRKVKDISQADVNLLCEQIAKERSSPVMAERVRALLSKIFNFAKARAIVLENPAKGLVQRETHEKELRILSFDELKILWRTLDQESLTIASIFRLLILSGQKPGQILSLRWRDIEFDVWRNPEDPEHCVFLAPQALEILSKLREVNHSEEFVFSNGKGGYIKHIRKAANRISKKMQLHHAWCPFDIRRSVQYRMLEIGIKPAVIEHLQNRKSSLARMRAYQQYDDSNDIRQAFLLWAQKIASLSHLPRPPELHPIKGGKGKVIELFAKR